ncbi:hypothetical protein GA0061078_1056 [Bifidobacterium bohemicum]|nr:hypothetical protein GA0061078_1056 [Bifidobacterium bohemicum]
MPSRPLGHIATRRKNRRESTRKSAGTPTYRTHLRATHGPVLAQIPRHSSSVPDPNTPGKSGEDFIP